jgi:predicted metal-dependent phosphoesterase TrpH
MRPLFVDLHTHSTASDGTDAPADVIRKAKRAGLSAVALTDHDTVEGCPEAEREARRVGIEFLPGIEVSCAYPRPGIIHMLGYGVEHRGGQFAGFTQRLQEARHERNLRLIDKLQQAGVRMDYDDVLAVAGGGQVGRPHFAKVLAAKGYISHPSAAYKYYLGNTGDMKVEKDEPSPAEAIDMIHAAGGVAVLAHPNQLRKQNHAQLAAEIRTLADRGLDGVECIYNDHRESFIHELKELCRRLDLLMTGGSDYHGSAKKFITLGRCGLCRRVPRKLYDRLLSRIRDQRQANREAETASEQAG